MSSTNGGKPPPNRARNLLIAEARRDGTKTLQELADEYGLTRERVRQIALRMGVDAREAAVLVRDHRQEELEEKIEDISDSVMMRYIAGDTIPELAKHFGVSAMNIREVLDENITDEIVAARSNFRSQMRYPEIGAGPLDQTFAPREDRYWTRERVWECLVKLAQENNGRLMSSTEYQKMSTGRQDLPSFRTVRVRLGRWTTIRAEVNQLLNKGTV